MIVDLLLIVQLLIMELLMLYAILQHNVFVQLILGTIYMAVCMLLTGRRSRFARGCGWTLTFVAVIGYLNMIYYWGFVHPFPIDSLWRWVRPLTSLWLAFQVPFGAWWAHTKMKKKVREEEEEYMRTAW